MAVPPPPLSRVKKKKLIKAKLYTNILAEKQNRKVTQANNGKKSDELRDTLES